MTVYFDASLLPLLPLLSFFYEGDQRRTFVDHFDMHLTNNQAEYRAVLAAIKKAKSLGADELEFYLDSELVVNQLGGNFKIKNKELSSLFVQIYNETLNFKKISFQHISRELNKEADRLVNLALDENKA